MPNLIAGVDEVGRGPLVGPVVAAAVILPDGHNLPLGDSKKLTEKKREHLAPLIKEIAIAYQIVEVSAQKIDEINILNATMLAMQQAVQGLSPQPTLVRIDGNRAPELTMPAECVVKGDSKHEEIMAASIIAKVYRDELMVALDAEYPQYGFAGHKGYPTKAHFAALAEHGPISKHRRSFGPVKRLLEAV